MPTGSSPSLATTIEFRIAGFTPGEDTRNVTAQLVREAMDAMDLTSADVRRIVITDEHSYGSAIREFATRAGYTNDGVYLGVGKNIPVLVNGAYQGSNLVLHHCLLGSFAPATADHPEGTLEALRYGFYHEFGHCVDHRRRPAQHEEKLRPDVGSHARQVAALNGETFLSEYAACFFSARFQTSAGYRYFANASRRNLETYLTALAAKRTQYRLGLRSLLPVRDAALDAFWRGLIEYGKMYAFFAGNPELASGCDLPAWPARNPATPALLAQLAQNLHGAWRAYPSCEAEFQRLIGEAWFALAAAEGFRFEVKPEGDYLWLT